jgi:uncharacterized protein with ParB-like and HNH nuclease domain
LEFDSKQNEIIIQKKQQPKTFLIVMLMKFRQKLHLIPEFKKVDYFLKIEKSKLNLKQLKNKKNKNRSNFYGLCC